jgi:hypothetical protein
MKSFLCGSTDYAYRPLDASVVSDTSGCVITFTDRTGTIEGGVSSMRQGYTPMTVVAFPAEPRDWTNEGPRPARLRTAAVSSGGSFTLVGLPAGDYCVVAVRSEQVAQGVSLQFLKKSAAKARRVHLGWGDDVVVALQEAVER